MRRVCGPTNGITRFFTVALRASPTLNLPSFSSASTCHRDGHRPHEIQVPSEADPKPRHGRHPILTCSTGRLPICPRTCMSLQMWLIIPFVNTSGSVPLCKPWYMQAGASHSCTPRVRSKALGQRLLWLWRLATAARCRVSYHARDPHWHLRLSLPCT